MSEKYYIIKATDLTEVNLVSEEMFIADRHNPYSARLGVVVSDTVCCNNGRWYDPELCGGPNKPDTKIPNEKEAHRD